jgi:hypothetical protein
MNVFYTNPVPVLCAKDHCIQHVRKMIVEYCQLLSTAHRLLDGKLIIGKSKTGRKQKQWILPDARGTVLYKATHVNHPSAVWVRSNSLHYAWLVEVVFELLCIYRQTSGKQHKVEYTHLINYLAVLPTNIANTAWEDPYIAINKDEYPEIVEDFKLGNTSVKDTYIAYMIQKFNEWQTRTHKRQITPTWPIQKPTWF